MALLRPSVWTQQPQSAFGLDPAFNPAYAWIGSQPLREIIKGLPVTGFNNGAGSTFEIGAAGRNAFLWTTGTPSRISISGAVSPGNEFIAVVNYQNFVDNNAAVFMAGKTFWNQSNGFMFASKTNTDTLEINGGDASTFPTISVPNVGKADGKIHTLVVGFKGTKARVAFDGRYIGEVTIAAAGTWPNGLAVGNYAGVANSATPGRKIYCAAVLGKGDIVSLSASPWQIFKPIPLRIFSPVSAGGGATITTNLGTASASGYQASISASSPVTINAALGTATASGLSATLAQAFTLQANRGTATASGAQATIAQAATISANLGTATASGFAADVQSAGNVTISANIGIATASGRQANIGDSVTVSASRGAAAAAGYTAALEVAYTLSANRGTAMATGKTATIYASDAIACAVGNAIASGYAALIVAGEIYARAPSGSGPMLITQNQFRPAQTNTSRYSNTGGSRR